MEGGVGTEGEPQLPLLTSPSSDYSFIIRKSIGDNMSFANLGKGNGSQQRASQNADAGYMRSVQTVSDNFRRFQRVISQVERKGKLIGTPKDTTEVRHEVYE